MKLYVVTSAYFEEEDFGGYQLHSNMFEGVFSSEIKAEQYIKTLPTMSELSHDPEPITYTIEEVILDETR